MRSSVGSFISKGLLLACCLLAACLGAAPLGALPIAADATLQAAAPKPTDARWFWFGRHRSRHRRARRRVRRHVERGGATSSSAPPADGEWR